MQSFPSLIGGKAEKNIKEGYNRQDFSVWHNKSASHRCNDSFSPVTIINCHPSQVHKQCSF